MPKKKTKQKKASAKKTTVRKKPAKRKTVKTKKTTTQKPTLKKRAVKKSVKKKVVKKTRKKNSKKTVNKKTVKVEIVKRSAKSANIRKSPLMSEQELDIESLIKGKKKTPTTHIIKKNQKPQISPYLIDLSNKVEIVDETPQKISSQYSQDNEIKLSKIDIDEQFTQPKLFILPKGWLKGVAAFIVLAIVIGGPIQAFSHFNKLYKTKDQVMELTKDAYSDLNIASQAISNKNLGEAGKAFDDAGKNFEQAKDQLDNINVLLQPILRIVPVEGKTLSDAQNLLQAGQNISFIGQELSEIFDYFYQDNSAITVKIAHIQDKIHQIVPIIEDTNNLIASISPEAIPTEFQDQFSTVKKQIGKFNKDIHTLDSFTEFLLDVLGQDQKKRYLVIFQNDRELRPTGGFMGSLALIDIYKGEVKNIEMPGGGTYDYQGTLYENLAPPAPLLLVNNEWQLQDANWYFDFEDSAQNIEWFFQKASGATVDGTIVVNASLVEKLLGYFPPIYMPEYGKTIAAENFFEETQKAVELEYDREENKPKQFISDMTPKLLELIFNAKDETLSDLMKTLNESFAKKDILVHLTDTNLQKTVKGYNWAGEVKNTSKDYLAIVDTNIMGGKTNHVISNDIELVSQIDNNGFITNHLTIKRKHNGDPTDIFEGMDNTSYLKIFVPLGSQLISAQGFTPMDEADFYPPKPGTRADKNLAEKIKLVGNDPLSSTEIFAESNKTVFANWIKTKATESNEIKISYMLPFSLDMPENETLIEKILPFIAGDKNSTQFYSLFIQKQPGTKNFTLKTQIKLPPKYKVKWIYPASSSSEYNNPVTFSSNLEKDQLFGFIFEPNAYVK